MAPELSTGEPPAWSTKSDIFAFAILVAEVYEGKLWENHRQKAILLIHQGDRPTQPASHPVDLWPMTTACWEHLPEHRPLTALVHDAWANHGLASTANTLAEEVEIGLENAGPKSL